MHFQRWVSPLSHLSIADIYCDIKLPANHKKAKSVIQEVREILEHMDAVYGEDLETSYYSSSLKESLNELKW